MKCVVVFLILASFVNCFPSFEQTASLGQSVLVQGGQETSIAYGNGPTLLVTLDTTANVTVKAWTRVKSLPNGFQDLPTDGGIQAGFSIDTEDAKIVSAQLFSPSIPQVQYSLLKGGVFGKIACVQVQIASNAFDTLTVQFDDESRRISVTIPESGTYLFATAKNGAIIPAFFNRTKDLPQGSTNFNFDDSFSLNVSVNVSTSITVNHYEFNPYTNKTTGESTVVPVNAFFQIHLDSKDIGINATLSFSYNATLLKELGIDVNTLKFAFWDEVKKIWTFLQSGATIDVNAGVITQSTNHFSAWGVFAESNDKQGQSGSQSSGSFIVPCFFLFATILALLI